MTVTFTRTEVPFLETRGSKGLAKVEKIVRYSPSGALNKEPKYYWLLNNVLAVQIGDQSIYIHMEKKAALDV
jgi:hypothetical protein